MLKDKGEWMTLSQAAELLGVHASTVRLWSDKGWIPVHRTPGKHRRYLRSEIELWAKASDRSHTMEPENIVQFALRRIRFQIHEGYLENESWYQQLDDEDRRQYRESGRALVQGLTSYLSAQGKDALAEARSVGYEYASRGVRSNLDRPRCVLCSHRTARRESLGVMASQLALRCRSSPLCVAQNSRYAGWGFAFREPLTGGFSLIPPDKKVPVQSCPLSGHWWTFPALPDGHRVEKLHHAS